MGIICISYLTLSSIHIPTPVIPSSRIPSSPFLLLMVHKCQVPSVTGLIRQRRLTSISLLTHKTCLNPYYVIANIFSYNVYQYAYIFTCSYVYIFSYFCITLKVVSKVKLPILSPDIIMSWLETAITIYLLKGDSYISYLQIDEMEKKFSVYPEAFTWILPPRKGCQNLMCFHLLIKIYFCQYLFLCYMATS
jgi:hypothetical protein